MFALEQAVKAGAAQRHVPVAIPRRKKILYPLYGRLGGTQGCSGRVRKISPPQGFDPQTVQPIVSRYTDWNIPAHGVKYEDFIHTYNL